MNLNRLNLIGILMMLFAVLIFFTNILDGVILTLTYPFLEGSSEGKSVILFIVMGSILFLYPLFVNGGLLARRFSLDLDAQKYLKLTILVVFFTYLFIIILEIWIRLNFNVSLFTIFVSFNQSASTTSIIHSHVLKSVLGYFISSSGIYIPSHINTGSSLTQYVSPIAFIAILSFPVVYLAGMISLDGRRELYKVILTFAVTTSLIGMLDGGMFSAPALVGLSGLLGIYFIKKPFSPRDILKPSVIIIILIIIRVSLGLIGNNADYHEITVINPSQNIDFSSYDVLSVEKSSNRIIVKLPGDINDKHLLLKLIADLKGKSDGFFISWNIFSWAPP